MKIALKDIKPNPFRDFKRNPLIQGVIDELTDSINDTGFWDNCVVRQNDKGEYELAYGHHRVAAALEAGETDANFIVRKLSDGMMLKIMDRENKKTYDNSVPALLESVRGVVAALAEGKIPPFKVEQPDKRFIMYAPSFTPGKVGDSPTLAYTATSVALYLGRTMSKNKVEKGEKKEVKANDSVQAALGALHLIELGVIQESSIRGMTVDKLLGFVRDLKKKQADYEEKRQKAQLDAKALQERQAKLDAQRREQEAKDKEAERKRSMALAEAKLEKDKEQIKALEEQRKKHREQAEARALVFKENRAKLDEKIEAAQERSEAFKPKPEETLRAQTVGAMVFKFNTIYSEASGIVKESEILGRNQKLTPNERELLRQAMLKAGERLRFGANNFLPPVN